MKKITRAERNCNPGNIRHSIVKYKNEVESQDTQFKKFSSMEWGYRAIFVLLYTYAKRYGLRTIPEMIARYAPPNENDTNSYSSFVCCESDIDPSTSVNTGCSEQMIPIVRAIAQMESGVLPNRDQVQQGWNLFVKHKP